MRPRDELRPGNRYVRPHPRPRTLQDVAAAKAALLARCRRCRYRKLLLPRDLAERLGADFPVDKLAPRLRCTSCGGRGMANVDEVSR